MNHRTTVTAAYSNTVCEGWKEGTHELATVIYLPPPFKTGNTLGCGYIFQPETYNTMHVIENSEEMFSCY